MYMYKYSESIDSLTDIHADKRPSFIFRMLNKNFLHLLSNDTNTALSKRSIIIRRLINPIIKKLGPLFLTHKQVFESRNALLNIDEKDNPIEFSDETVIWCGNHGFKDDTLATVLSARHSYILFGSLPMFFNTFDGVTAYINGVVLCNRKVKASRQASVEKCKFVLENGADLVMFPEGVWNKTPEKLVLDLWPGIYKIAKETGRKIVPVIHYLKDPEKKYKGNVIHTVIADPISMDGLSEQEGLELIRDTIATWYYLMIEKYGKSMRTELISSYHTSERAWEDYIAMHTSSVAYYDREIELNGDFNPKHIVRQKDVWEPIAKLEINSRNYTHVMYARQLVDRLKREDFQHRF